jgi:hypothetical protein
LSKRIILATFICILAASFSAAPRTAAQTPQNSVSFSHDILPILSENCLKCHGESMQLSKLNLSSRQNALKGGSTGAAIIPGNAEDSKLYRMVAGLDKPPMPMGGKLSTAQVESIKAWIDQGAQWEAGPVAAKAEPGGASPFADLENATLPPGARDYWAFKLPVQAPVPSVSQTAKNPMDQFLEKQRKAKGVTAAPKADRLTLLRRAYMDLIGLPPSPQDIEAFMADNAPDAWARLIDKLLASPQYGERWGRHWLDVARYADSGGYQNDTDRPHFWRYRDYVIKSFNEDKPYNLFIKEQIAGDEFENRTDDNLIATGFLRAGPRVQHREKDNPERRHDYLDDVLSTIGKGVLGLTVGCARCHDHKFDPILQKDYHALHASIYGYVEVDYPLGPREEADAYMRKTFEIADKISALRDEIEKIEAPYQYKLALVQIREKYPENVLRAVEKPESERTPGEKLLATQVLESAITIPTREIDKIMSPEDASKKKDLAERIAALNGEKPKAPPMAHITTDGDWRATGAGTGDGTKGACPVCELEYQGAKSFLELGPGKGEYETPPSYFLIRGDPNSKAYATKPGFLSVITYGNPPTELRPADGRTSGRRLALAEWLISRENPLTARVMVNRIWHHHFGRGIVATLDNFGKMGEQPSHPELLDWLAVEFMNRGWSIKQMHKLIMSSDAYQMAAEFNNAANAAADPDNKLLWKYRVTRLEGEIIRDSVMAVAGTLDPTMGGPPIFPFVPKELLDSIERGIWRNQPDGPKVWRRSVYIYAKRSLPFPMVHVFDLADLNVSFGARNVSTVPTQALTLLNNDFVLRQAQLFADRLKKDAGEDVSKQIDLGYMLALTRHPTDKEMSMASDMIGTGSLVDFTHVLLNLSEFLYTR